jgi:hypothetical protein
MVPPPPEIAVLLFKMLVLDRSTTVPTPPPCTPVPTENKTVFSRFSPAEFDGALIDAPTVVQP